MILFRSLSHLVGQEFMYSTDICDTDVSVCEYEGRLIADGSEFQPNYNPCLNCTCRDTLVRCTSAACPPTPELPCRSPQPKPGECCPSICTSEWRDSGNGPEPYITGRDEDSCPLFEVNVINALIRGANLYVFRPMVVRKKLFH